MESWNAGNLWELMCCILMTIVVVQKGALRRRNDEDVDGIEDNSHQWQILQGDRALGAAAGDRRRV